jgi:hypothetical protein
MQAGQFVQVIEERQGLKWVVLRKLLGGFISEQELKIWLNP